MTKQETFDTVVNHLRKQGVKAVANVVGNAVCRYRAPGGLKCAAGCLIPDDRYNPALEGEGVHPSVDLTLPPCRLAVTRLIQELGHDLPLVSRLQTIHDASYPPYWEVHFESLAKSVDLVYTPREAGTA